jgi:pimeloyl-ACP methyl ester carboxylesterase
VEIVPRVGHFLHLEQPATIARLALDWFDRS